MVGRFGGSSAGFVVAALIQPPPVKWSFVGFCLQAFYILALARREMFAANSERPWERRPTGRIVPVFGHGDQTFALGLFPGSFARTSDGFRLLAGVALRRLFVGLATLHLTKNALTLHLLL
jgi:uncharacterized membrane protein YfcA